MTSECQGARLTMKHPIHPTLMAAALVAALASCSDSTGGGGGQNTLTFLSLAGTAPPLCADSAGAKFGKDPNGQDQDIALYFPASGNVSDCAAGPTEDFLRLKLKPTSLLRYPDGNLIANGDSVYIYVKWVGSDSILFDLQPSGLIFDPAQPAELRIEYAEASDDLNHDGRVDAEDTTIEHELDIWRQENPGDPFVRVGTGKAEDSNEIEARLNGFSRYAIAY
jgi:hypothetical protein